MRRCFTFVLSLVLSTCVYAQSFTKEAMLSDFDFLLDKIAKVDPNLEIRNQVTKTDILAQMQHLRKDIDTVPSDADFYRIITKALFLCQDAHAGVISRYSHPDIDTTIVNQAKQISSEYINKYYRSYLPALFNSLRAFYVGGKYYFPAILDRQKNMQIPNGAELLAINNIPIDEYMRKWNVPVHPMVKWNFQTGQFYTDLIFLPRCTDLGDRTTKVNYAYNRDTLSITLEPHAISYPKREKDDPRVNLFEKDKILYIRIPSMHVGMIDYFKQELSALKGRQIDKVVIDIRGNGGGNDMVWQEVLSSLVDQPIKMKQKVCFKDNSTVRACFERDKVEIENESKLDLNGIRFFCSDGEREIPVGDQSLMYAGNIYIMVDDNCFSSALALAGMCSNVDRLVSVGVPSGFLGGEGVSPLNFILPNSKFIFRLPVSLDANVASDDMRAYYHQGVEVSVSPSVDYYLSTVSHDERYFNPFSEEYLYNYDPIFQKVLSLFQ